MGRILKELSVKGIKRFTQLFIVILHTNHFSAQWNVMQTILIPKSRYCSAALINIIQVLKK